MSTNPDVSPRTVRQLLHLPVTSNRKAFESTARATGRLIVALPAPSVGWRSRLAAFVADRVDAELAQRGASDPSADGSDLSSRILDAIYRARLLGSAGLALAFGDLSALVMASSELGLEDSRTLQRLMDLAQRHPLQVHFPAETARLGVVGESRPLEEWLSSGAREGRVACIEYEAERDLALDDLRKDALPQPAGDARLRAPELAAFSTGGPESERRDPLDEPSRTSVERVEPPSTDAQAITCEAGQGESPSAREAPPDPARQRRCASWAEQLSRMSGPKVHSTVERAFVTAYVPLCHEVAAGVAPNETRSVAQCWAEGFAQSYAAAFKTLEKRRQRPKMVRDVLEISSRWLGRHHARQCQILLVDGMRFDLGQRLNEAIETRLRGHAVCADQTLLWAALPSNRRTQALDDGTRSPATDEGGTSHQIEELVVGARSMFRLDRISSDLGRPGEPEAERLDRLAESLAASVVPWMQSQPRDTLVVLFGDHGFHWQSTPRGTGPAQRGGALPEQVLVPASGWLLSGGVPGAPSAVATPLVH